MGEKSQFLVMSAVLLLAGAAQGASLGTSIYFGHLHNHTGLSDGSGTPDQAYSTAKAAGLDFFGLSDHGEALTAAEFTAMKTAADAHNVAGFTTFWGFEWSHGSYGHITVVNPSGYTSANTTPTFSEFMSWLDGEGAVAFLNHPGRQDGSSSQPEFEHFLLAPSSSIVGMELWNKGTGFSDFYYNGGYTSDNRDRSGYYDEAQLNGWSLGAAGSEDHHGTSWGSGSYRLAVLAGGNSRDSILSALRARSFYSTLDRNLELTFYVDGSPMGSTAGGGLSHCEVRAADRDDEGFSKVEVIHNGYVVHTASVGGSTLPVVTCDVFTQRGDYLYCKVTQSDGGEAISSPVFITSDGPDGPPRADLAAPPDNGPDDFDPAEDQVTVNTVQPSLKIQLRDFEGIADSTVVPGTVSIAGLTQGTDYTFAYDGTMDLITLAPVAGGGFGNGTYTIALSGISDLATPANRMTETVLTVRIDTTIVPPETLHFQQSTDTMIHGAYPTTSYGGYMVITADGEDGGKASHVLLQFANLIGNSSDQIPPYAIISSATLRLRSLDSGNGGSLYAMLQPWYTTSTWNSLGDGVRADGIEASSLADGGIGANSPGDVDIDVTGTLQSWVDGTRENYGWVVLPGGADGWDIASAENGTADYRPELIVSFTAGGDRPPVAVAGPDQTVADADNSKIEDIELDGSNSYHPQSSTAWIASYTWTVGEAEIASGSGQPAPVTRSFDVGVHTVVLTVTDNRGVSDTDALVVTVAANRSPTADAGGDRTVSDTSGDGSEVVILDGSHSTDADGTISSYVWTIDGGVVSDANGDGIVAVTLGLGSHTVQLTVTDNGDASSTDTAVISIETPSLFREDFESGGLDAGGWYASAQGSVETTSAHTGTYGVLLKKASSVETIISTDGAAGATFTYWARTDGMNNERLYVEWANGGTWTELNTLSGTTGWAQFSHTLPLTGASFMIRFRTDGNAGNDLAMIDDIVIRAAGATGGNRAPIASNDSATTEKDTSVTIDVLSNDSDADGDALTVVLVATPAHGSATVNADNTVTYTPAVGYSGSDSLSYSVSDGKGGTDTATVAVTVTDVVTDVPPAAPQSLTATAGDGTVTLDWADNVEPDLSHYKVYCSLGSDAYSLIAGPVIGSAFTDRGLLNGQTYHYKVTAVDTAGFESSESGVVFATPSAPTASLSIGSISPNVGVLGTTVRVTISGTGFVAGLTVALESGVGPVPTVSNVVVSATEVQADLYLKAGGPSKTTERPWDVRVRNPDGSTVVKTGGFTIKTN